MSLLIAVGLMRLVSTYSGDLIRLVRASDAAELDIGMDADGYLDNDAADTFLAATTGKVVTMYDQSGSGNHLTQATDADRPNFLQADGRDQIDDYPAVHFVRTSSTNGTILTAPDSGNVSGSVSFACTINPLSLGPGTEQVIYGKNPGSSGAGEIAIVIKDDAEAGQLGVDRPFIAVGTASGTAMVLSRNTFGGDVDGTNVAHFLEETATGTSTLVGGTDGSAAHILGAGNIINATGQDFPYSGYLRHFMLWDSLETAARETAEKYMANEIPVTADATLLVAYATSNVAQAALGGMTSPLTGSSLITTGLVGPDNAHALDNTYATIVPANHQMFGQLYLFSGLSALPDTAPVLLVRAKAERKYSTTASGAASAMAAFESHSAGTPSTMIGTQTVDSDTPGSGEMTVDTIFRHEFAPTMAQLKGSTFNIAYLFDRNSLVGYTGSLDAVRMVVLYESAGAGTAGDARRTKLLPLALRTPVSRLISAVITPSLD